MIFKINNLQTTIEGATPTEHDIVANACTFSWVYFQRNYVTKRPERKTQRLCYLQGSKFPSGLLGKVGRALEKSGVWADVEDNREQPSAPTSFKYKFPSKLRYYQEDCVKKCIEATRGIIWIPTRGGKTWIAQKIALELRLPTLIVVGGIELLYQFHEDMKKRVKAKKIGFIGDGNQDIKLINIATIQTLNSRSTDSDIKAMFDRTQVLIIDEAHHIKNKGRKLLNTWFDLAMRVDAYYRFGFTGTPGNPGDINRDLLEAATGGVVYHKPIQELIDEGFVAQPKVEIHYVRHTRSFRSWQDAEKDGIVENVVRNSLITNLALENSKEGPVFTSCNKIQHVKNLGELLPTSTQLWAQGTESSVRSQVLKEFTEGKIPILISTLLREGVDIPKMQTMIRASGGCTEVGVQQTGNRVLTADVDKSYGKIIDFMDLDGAMLEKHSKARLKVYKDQGFPVEEFK